MKLKINRSILSRGGATLCLGLLLGIVYGFAGSTPAHALDLPVTHVSGTLSNDQTWTAGNVYMVDNTLTIPSDKTLTIQAGAIVKYTHYATLVVATDGTLNVQGSATNKVVFTSYRDDAEGGDSNTDGPSSGAYRDYDQAIQVNWYTSNSIIDVEHAEFKNGEYGFRQSCTYGQNIQSTVRDSLFKSGIDLTFCSKTAAVFERNTFSVEQYYPIRLNNSDPAGLDLSGVNKNIINGSGETDAVLLVGSALQSGSTWDVEDATLVTSTFSVYGTLNLRQGTILKVTQGQSGVTLQDGGTANLTGSSTSPVVFTSIRDDSHGGDTNNDGANSTPAALDYWLPIEILANNVDLSVSHSNIYYPQYGFSFSRYLTDQVMLSDVTIDTAQRGLDVTYSNVVFRGVMRNISDRFVSACSWGESDCSVDATYSDWGSVSGSQGKVCGQVAIAPWKYNGTVQQSNFMSPNCGASNNPSAELNYWISYYQQRVGLKEIDCNNGYQDACDAMQDAYACLSSAVNLAASASPFPVPEIHTNGDIDTYGETAKNAAQAYIAQEATEVVTGNSTVTGALFNIFNTFDALSHAYNNCSP